MNEELDNLLRETLYLSDDISINDEMFPGSITEWDSLSHMNLIYNITDRYDITLSFKELKEIKNWGQLKEYVNKKIGK